MISVVLPCRNEEKTVGACIKRIQETLDGKDYEIIVSDSSTDRSPQIARELGAKVVKHDKKGYGIAYLEAFKHARGDVIVMGDSDNTYDFSDIPKLLSLLGEYDLVMGERTDMEPGAMPPLHRYVGNPGLSLMLSVFFGKRIRDAHSGFRAIKKSALDGLELKTTGMEFAAEMIIKALKNGLKLKEVPVSYRRRIEKSKLSSFSDGWRHLRFMLMYAPDYLYLLPGILSFVSGLLLMLVFLGGSLRVWHLTFYTAPMILGSFLTILGFNIILLGLYAKTFAVSTGFEKKDPLVELLAAHLSFERGLLLGSSVFAAAITATLVILANWIYSGFFGFKTPNLIIMLFTIAVIGLQTIFSTVFLSMMLVEK